MRVTLLKNGNRLVVSPTTTKIYDLLAHQLSFTEKRFFHGPELREAKLLRRPPFEEIDWQCFSEDHRQRLAAPFGFWHRIARTLKAAGYQVAMRDLAPPKDPERLEPDWTRLAKYDLRYGQDEYLVKLFGNPCGRFDCPPGYGKSFLMGLAAAACPKATFDIVTAAVSVARDRIYPELCTMLPDVGIVGGGLKKKDHRVMVYTADSAHHSPGTSDFLLLDECHQFGADARAARLGRWLYSRNYGLSASHDMRLDNKDLRVEGICGPIIFKIPYEQAQEHGLVVPVEVHLRLVVMDYDPCEGLDDVAKKRHGIWRNDYRNDLIAEDARSYEDEQVLITCEVLEHAIHLKQRLPEFTLMYREGSLTPADRARYAKQGLLDPREPLMDIERRQRLTRRFEQGKLRKVICTTVWNVGVDFRQLEVLIRADAGGSPINDTQIPGRTTRIFAGKKRAIIRDYLDRFNVGFNAKSTRRVKNYEVHGWQIVYPDGYKQDLLW